MPLVPQNRHSLIETSRNVEIMSKDTEKVYLIYFLVSTYLQQSDSKKEIEPCLNKYLTLHTKIVCPGAVEFKIGIFFIATKRPNFDLP